MKRVCFEFGSTNVGSSVIGTGRSEGSLLLLPYFCQFRYYYPLITYLKPKISSWHILTSSFRSKSRLLTFITFIFFFICKLFTRSECLLSKICVEIWDYQNQVFLFFKLEEIFSCYVLDYYSSANWINLCVQLRISNFLQKWLMVHKAETFKFLADHML